MVTGVPLLGALPDGAGGLEPPAFLDTARQGLAAELGGVWSPPPEVAGLPGCRDFH